MESLLVGVQLRAGRYYTVGASSPENAPPSPLSWRGSHVSRPLTDAALAGSLPATGDPWNLSRPVSRATPTRRRRGSGKERRMPPKAAILCVPFLTFLFYPCSRSAAFLHHLQLHGSQSSLLHSKIGPRCRGWPAHRPLVGALTRYTVHYLISLGSVYPSSSRRYLVHDQNLQVGTRISTLSSGTQPWAGMGSQVVDPYSARSPYLD